MTRAEHSPASRNLFPIFKQNAKNCSVSQLEKFGKPKFGKMPPHRIDLILKEGEAERERGREMERKQKTEQIKERLPVQSSTAGFSEDKCHQISNRKL